MHMNIYFVVHNNTSTVSLESFDGLMYLIIIVINICFYFIDTHLHLYLGNFYRKILTNLLQSGILTRLERTDMLVHHMAALMIFTTCQYCMVSLDVYTNTDVTCELQGCKTSFKILMLTCGHSACYMSQYHHQDSTQMISKHLQVQFCTMALD